MSNFVLSGEFISLTSIDRLRVQDTAVEERFDRLTRLAAHAFRVPAALVFLVNSQRQWCKSTHGLDIQQISNLKALCIPPIISRSMLVVEDAGLDSHLIERPLVTSPPHVRFYAAQPLYSDGHAVGTLCVIDYVPRLFENADRQALQDFAILVEKELNQTSIYTGGLTSEHVLQAQNDKLNDQLAEKTTELNYKVKQLSNEAAQRAIAEGLLRKSQAWNRTIIQSSYTAFIGTDEYANVVEWNPSAERIFGWRLTDVIGRNIADLIVPKHLNDAFRHQILLSQDADVNNLIDRNIEVQAQTMTGRIITIEVMISLYEFGGKHCFGAFINDISERVRSQNRLEEKQELLDAVLESIDVAVVASDAVGNLTLFNKAARVFHGLDLKAVASSEWSRYYSLYQIDGLTPLVLEDIPLVKALKGELVQDQAMVIAPEGLAARTLLASGRQLRSNSGRALGAVVVMKDITELNASREKLMLNEGRLRAITESLPASISKVSQYGKFVFLNEYALKIHGKEAEELIGQDVAKAYTSHDYAKLAPYIERAQMGERVYFEFVISSSHQDSYYQCSLVPQRLANGKPDGFLAMASDITERKLSEMNLAESEDRLRTITDNLPVLIAQLDNEQRYCFVNATHSVWLGKPAEKIIGKTIEQAFGNEFSKEHAPALIQAWTGKVSHLEYEIIHENTTRIFHSIFLPQLREGVVSSVYILTTDATTSRQHERNLSLLAHTDTLTNLPNRRQFDSTIKLLENNSHQQDDNIALLYLDIDHFKRINDTYGHAVGDAVLIEFARRLRSAVRSSDFVARLAGDEFTVILYDVNSYVEVEYVLRKILESVRLPFVLPECTLDVRTTIGASIAPRTAIVPQKIMESADKALYEAKEAGRNTYAIYNLCKPLGAEPKLADD